ncbi:hypothetical protein LOY38_18360 [Pseudomonas sp. B21-015]|uniref:hypothetical protein n=1 Tax=Pseudomonas sp. B21-015 TaxID=2895473 RepID=UPI002160C918|nr:hypothetical protein [Pseudomonas sp. B21-015]UVM48345.1 hypothetical protein LOY38_18360 [Pseudomonas sp. B21-015]
MARRIEYFGDPVLTLEQVAFQCRVESEDMEPALIEQIIIPGVTAQCESKTGAAIRGAIYEEDWPANFLSGHALDVGQASELVSIMSRQPDGTWIEQTVPVELQQGQRESFLFFPGTRPAGPLRIRYKAGLDLELNPGVRNWLLMAAATIYRHPEMFLVGQTLAELPSAFLDHLVADITVPPRF